MDAGALGDLVSDPHDRVERAHRLLEYHPDPPAADLIQPGLPQARQVGAAKDNRARGHLRVRGKQAEDRLEGHALARAGLADEADGLARRDLERDSVDGADDALVAGDLYPQVADLKLQRAAHDVARPEEVGEAVADQRQGQAGDHDREARDGSQLPLGGEEVLPGGDHGAPVWRGGLDAQPQVAEGDDGEDVLDDVGHRVDDRLRDHVGQQVAPDDPHAGQAARLGGEDVLLSLGDGDLAAGDAGVGDPADGGDGDVDALLAAAEDEHQRDDQHEEGEGDDDVDDAHDDGVNPAAEVAGQAAQDRAENEREDHRDDGDAQVHLAAVEQPGPGVAAFLVSAEQVAGLPEAKQRLFQVLGVGVERGQQGRAVAHEQDDRQQHQARYQGRLAVPAAAACPDARGGRRRSGFGVG